MFRLKGKEVRLLTCLAVSTASTCISSVMSVDLMTVFLSARDIMCGIFRSRLRWKGLVKMKEICLT